MLKSPFLLAVLLLCGLSNCPAALRLSPLFTPHAVLQESSSTAVWGEDVPGQEIRVTYGASEAGATADKSGFWLARLDVSASGPGAKPLIVKGSTTLEVPDVIPGEVWLASGQSNMEWILGKLPQFRANPPKESNPNVRMFTVRQDAALKEDGAFAGSWQLAKMPELGGFSAVGYFFAEALSKGTGKPVGIVNSSVGGTPIQAWMSAKALAKDSETKEALEKSTAAAAAFPAARNQFLQSASARMAQAGWVPEGPENLPPLPEAESAGWQSFKIPGGFPPDANFPGGVLWLSHTLESPTPVPSGPLRLAVSGLRGGFETVYWNGRRLGGTTPDGYAGDGALHNYEIPAGGVVAGKNSLLLRVAAPFNGLRFERPPTLSGFPKLEGPWRAWVEAKAPVAAETAPMPPEPLPPIKNTPAQLFQRMIEPLRFATIRGILWYQGEANVGHHDMYARALRGLIGDWRAHFGDVSFLICQLPGYLGKSDDPSGNKATWAFFREAQAAALALPATGMATLIDLGEATNIHPSDKEPVGQRLAAIALRDTYGKDIPATGPTLREATREGAAFRITFNHAEGGLVAAPIPSHHPASSSPPTQSPLVRNRPSSQLEGFAVCGADRKWSWADATIEGETVLVRSPDVPEPVAVRYAWDNNPTVNLFNKAGFPAAPFRTDMFPINE